MMLASLAAGGDPAAGRMLVVTDPPRHAKLRRVVNGSVSPRVIRRLERTVRRVVDARLDEALERGTCDVVEVVAAPLPVAVVCDLMGIPETDWALLHDLTSRAFGFDDPAFQERSAHETKAGAHAEIMLYYSQLLDERRGHPGDDLVSVLASGEVDGEPLADEEILLNCDNLVLGGNETTRHSAAGALLALATHPDEWERLRSDPALVPQAVEEVLRWTTPAMHVLRVATRDGTVGGTAIAAGEAVTIWNASANRDERVFARASSFDVGRTPNRHLAFGFGEHFCVGAAIARLELRTLLEAVVERVRRLEVAGEPDRLRSNFIRGYRRLPLRLDPS